MSAIDELWRFLTRLLGVGMPLSPPPGRAEIVHNLLHDLGIRLVESDPKGTPRPLTDAELRILHDTIASMGSAWYEPFLDNPLSFWIDRSPGGGQFGNGWLRIGDPGPDLSVLYRILIHEGTHASNEYRGWPYENEWCTKPGLDWRKTADGWTHPRQQGQPQQPGPWESLPVDARDVSTAPGEDLAEMVRYYVHSVKNERAYLWPLDRSLKGIYLWDTSPTRHVFVRDIFLRLVPDHPLYKKLPADLESQAAHNLGR